MRRHTQLTGGFDPEMSVVRWFWEVILSFSAEHRAKLLKFVTSCSRPPLLGFAHLNPPFTIQRVNIRNDSERLPTASTCMNLLKLPTYSSCQVLREKLLFSISSNQGFELS